MLEVGGGNLINFIQRTFEQQKRLKPVPKLLCVKASNRKHFMIYDKANFYFHFFLSLFSILPHFLAAFQLKKDTVESRFRFSGNGKWTKIKEAGGRICAGRNFHVMTAGEVRLLLASYSLQGN